jgi:hypothetical protein
MRYTLEQVRRVAESLAKALAAIQTTEQEGLADDRAVQNYNWLRVIAVEAKPGLEAQLPGAFATAADGGNAMPKPTYLEVRSRCDQIRIVLNNALLGPGLRRPAKERNGGRE